MGDSIDFVVLLRDLCFILEGLITFSCAIDDVIIILKSSQPDEAATVDPPLCLERERE